MLLKKTVLVGVTRVMSSLSDSKVLLKTAVLVGVTRVMKCTDIR